MLTGRFRGSKNASAKDRPSDNARVIGARPTTVVAPQALHFLNSSFGGLPLCFHAWPHLSKAEKGLRREQLDAAFTQFNPDTYQARLSAWLRHNAGAGFAGTVSDNDARYIERIAWECVKALQIELSPGRTDTEP